MGTFSTRKVFVVIALGLSIAFITEDKEECPKSGLYSTCSRESRAGIALTPSASGTLCVPVVKP